MGLLIIVHIAASMIMIGLMGMDKFAAKLQYRRIPENILHLVEMLGKSFLSNRHDFSPFLAS